MNTYPKIVVEVPHQRPAFAYPLFSRADLVRFAEKSAGDDWSWSLLEQLGEDGGSFNLADVDDDELWDALTHDLHTAYLIEREEWAEWHPTAPHQAFLARSTAEKVAEELDWPQEP